MWKWIPDVNLSKNVTMNIYLKTLAFSLSADLVNKKTKITSGNG